MKIKPLFICLVPLLTLSSSYALQLTSQVNGPVFLPEKQLKVGDKAPIVTLTNGQYKKVTFGGATGKVQIVSSIESFNTSVCDQQTMWLNKIAPELKNTTITVVTTNQPFIVNAYQQKHHIHNIQVASAFQNSTFGLKYGVQVIGGELKGITARSMFVINPKGVITYKQITHNIDHMPNLKAVLAAAKEAAKQ